MTGGKIFLNPTILPEAETPFSEEEKN